MARTASLPQVTTTATDHTRSELTAPRRVAARQDDAASAPVSVALDSVLAYIGTFRVV